MHIKVTNRVKFIILLQKQIKKIILGLVAIVILQFTKMNNGNNDISIDTKQMKFDQNLA